MIPEQIPLGRGGLALVLALFIAVAAASAPACGGDSEPALPGGPSGLEGVVALAVAPPAAALELAYGDTAVQQLSAVASYADGSSRDVTAAVSWSTDLSDGVVEAGLLTVSVAGAGLVTAEGGGHTASATVTVKVTGQTSLSGTPAGAGDKLAGSPAGSVKPAIVYPLAGSLFPFNLGATELHLAQGDPSQSLARIDVSGDLIDLHILGPCNPIPGGCVVTLEDELVPMLAGASSGTEMLIRVRLAAADGSALGESDPIDVRWTFTEVRGGLYYWTARNNADTHIYRYDLDAKGTPPQAFFSDQSSPPLHDGTPTPCVGCHAVSLDGRKIGLTFGGSDPSDFALVDVATRQPIAVRNTDPEGFATFSALSPDAERVVTALRGTLTLRTADAALASLGEIASAETAGEALTQPFWSADGLFVAYVGWVPGQNGASDSFNGDVARGAQIFVTESSGGMVAGPTRLLVQRLAGHSSYYPAISDDSEWVVFNRSRCDGPPGFNAYGQDPCDGYDDASAQLFVVPLAGGQPVRLERASGTDTWTSSWPRWAPTHGTFRGKSIYFIAFSSKRPYGLRLEGSNIGATPPQLWLAAVTLEPGEAPAGDPSFAPVWLPLQNEDMSSPTGNHVPQWAAKAMPIPR